MKLTNLDFQNALRAKVEAAEHESGVELVVAVLPQVQPWRSAQWCSALIWSQVALAVLMLIPTEFWYILIWLAAVVFAMLGFMLPHYIPALKRLLVGQRRMRWQVKERARAMYQQAGIHETQARVGVLVVVARLERQAIVLWDKGIAERMPEADLQFLEARMQAVFEGSDLQEAVLRALDDLRPIFTQHIPADIHPINELPDDPWMQ